MESTENKTENVPDKIQPVVESIGKKLAYVGHILWLIARNIFMLVFGMFLGMGIVLKDPPKNAKLEEKYKNLEKENKELKESLDVIKNGVIKPFQSIYVGPSKE